MEVNDATMVRRIQPRETVEVEVGDSEKYGRYSKNQTMSLRLHLGDRIKAILYGAMNGLTMDSAKKVIEIAFSGLWNTGERDNEWEEAVWLAVIEGQRLDELFAHLCEGRLLWVKPTGKVEDLKKPEVEAIFVRRLD
jgi:hypothetical protein